jgi:quinol monooxygenase YgiN
MQDPTSATLKTCSIAMRFDAADLPKALELLLSAVGPTRAKHGCRSCHVDRDAIEPDRVRYEEEWDSGEALMRHVRSQDFLFVLLALDLCREEPEVRVADLSAQRGMGVLRNLRESGPGVGRDQARVRPHPRPA